MGLDQYAYTASQAGSWDNSRELAYWRKHPNLQGWMERLYIRKAQETGNNIEADENWNRSGFNGIELELTWEDLEQLEKDIKNNNLPNTQGFFFGNNSDDHYRYQDLKFIRNAKAEIFVGLRVFYNSSW